MGGQLVQVLRDGRAAFVSALEVAEGRGRPTGAEFLGKIRYPVGEGD